MPEDIAISLKNVSKDFRLPHERADSLKSLFVNPFNKNRNKFEIQHALSDVSFDIPKGEFFGIVGRNGSGKSTLLKIIAGIYEVTKGSVQVNGRLVPFIELGVGFNPELTGRENVFMNGALMGFSEKEVKAKYKAIIEFAELERFMDQKLKNYSSGMQVRLAFSVATILAESDILLIDEVLAVGDADFQRKCFEYFRKLKKDKKTVVFVSHDMNAVREYCDKAILIDDSKVVFSGTAEKAAKEYTRLFLPDEYKANTKEEQLESEKRLRQENNGKWGAGGVDMNEIHFSKTNYTQDDDFIEFNYKISADKSYDDELMVGLVIRNEQGQILTGTNSKIIKFPHRISITGGETIDVMWKIPNFFNDGIYTLEIAADSIERSQLIQWWDNATTFRVSNDEKTPYLVAPKITLEIHRK